MELRDFPTFDGAMNDYDWENSIAVCDFYSPSVPTHQTPVKPITHASIAEVTAFYGFGGSEAEVVYLARLYDGRYAFVEAWCDYTGWDCQAGGTCTIGSLSDLLSVTITDDQKRDLGL